MTIDKLVEGIIAKRNPCIVGIDPEWDRLPRCYQTLPAAQGLLQWGQDVIDAVADIVPAVKPQMAFFEVFGPEGLRVHRQLTDYAHSLGLMVIDDSKRNDIGNTARAYAYAHLAKAGPVNADFLTINPFLSYDSMQPFLDTAAVEGKGLFVLVKTSNPGSRMLSEAVCEGGETLRNRLAAWVNSAGMAMVGQQGYSALGAVAGATYPEEAEALRQRMPRSFFLVPGFGRKAAQRRMCSPALTNKGWGRWYPPPGAYCTAMKRWQASITAVRGTVRRCGSRPGRCSGMCTACSGNTGPACHIDPCKAAMPAAWLLLHGPHISPSPCCIS